VAHVGRHPQAANGGVEQLVGRLVGRRLDSPDGGELVADPGRGLGDPLPLRRPRLDHRLHHRAKARHPLAGLGREVGAPVERDPVGIQEDGHRPATLPGHPLDRLHVDGVDVRAFLAVDLDRHEVLVHVGGGVGILERLPLHHVAPVAGRVADRQQDRPVLGSGQLERIGAPGTPVDRVVLVLEEVRAGLVGEAIRHPK
jgi:hypothetical protein